MVSDKDGLAGGTLAETLLQNRGPVMNYAVAVGRAHQNQNAWRGNLTRAGSTAGVVVALICGNRCRPGWAAFSWSAVTEGCFVWWYSGQSAGHFGLLPRREQMDRDKRPMA